MTGQFSEQGSPTSSRALRLIARTVYQAGLSLVELIIYVALSALILSLVGGFLVRAVLTAQDVKSTVQATNMAQLLIESIRSDVRNASEIILKPSPENTKIFLAVRTAGKDEEITWLCQAWYFYGDIAYSSKWNTAPVAMPIGDVPDPEIWTVFGKGIKNVALAMNSDSGAVEVSFTVEGTASAVVNTVLSPRGPISGESCFAE